MLAGATEVAGARVLPVLRRGWARGAAELLVPGAARHQRAVGTAHANSAATRAPAGGSAPPLSLLRPAWQHQPDWRQRG